MLGSLPIRMKMATCHPEKRAYVKGLCKACDSKRRYDADPSILIRMNEKRRERYNSDPVFRAKRQAEAKKWIKDNYERWSKQSLKSYHRHRPRIIKARSAKRHGISLEFYETLVRVHKGRCAICGNSCSTKRSLAIDHDHTTGMVRGLLCQKCNHGIGLFKDNPERLRAAAEYLETFFFNRM